MTDEKKNVKKSKKNEPGEKQHDINDTENASSSGQQSGHSTKSVQSVFQVLSSCSAQSKTNNINELPAESSLESQSVQAATNALSVTARWGLNGQPLDAQSSTDGCNPVVTTNQITESIDNHVSESNTSGDQVNDKEVATKWTKENTPRNNEKKDKRKGCVAKLRESLHARVGQKDTQSKEHGNGSQASAGTDLPGLTSAASEQDLSDTHPDVPDQGDFGSRRSSLKLVCCFLYTCVCMYTHCTALNVIDYFQCSTIKILNDLMWLHLLMFSTHSKLFCRFFSEMCTRYA